MNINGRMKVKTLKAEFKEEFGLSIRVYDGRNFADEDSTLASVRKGDSKGGEFSPKKNTKVGNLEDKILEIFGIKTQISGSDDSYLCNNDLTLKAAFDEDVLKMERKARKESKQNDVGVVEGLNENTTEKKLFSSLEGNPYLVAGVELRVNISDPENDSEINAKINEIYNEFKDVANAIFEEEEFEGEPVHEFNIASQASGIIIDDENLILSKDDLNIDDDDSDTFDGQLKVLLVFYYEATTIRDAFIAISRELDSDFWGYYLNDADMPDDIIWEYTQFESGEIIEEIEELTEDDEFYNLLNQRINL